MTPNDQVTKELIDLFHRAMQWYERGLFTSEETTSQLILAIYDHVDALYADLDHPSRESKIDSVIVETAKTETVTREFLSRACRVSPPGNDVRLDEVIGSFVSSVRGVRDIEDPGTFDLIYAWLEGSGKIHEDLAESLSSSDPLSAASWLLYLHARNEGDEQTASQIIGADLRAGCPASLLYDLDRANATSDEVTEALSRIDHDSMRREHRWGDLASVAVFLAERGWYKPAGVWSGLIPSELVLPLMTFADQAHHSVLGVSEACAISNDARVLAPLALIDLLAGDLASADHRIEWSLKLDRDVGHLFGGFVAHRALIHWVRSRLVSDHAMRRRILEDFDPHDAWLGRLQAQIDMDLADLLERDGDVVKAGNKRVRATAIAANRPEVELYTAPFPYNNLLHHLPFMQK